MERNQGFTLIELVIVIVILGILSAIALPKFIDLTDDALQAKISANAGALRSGVTLANMKWRALGSPDDFSQRDNVQLYGSNTAGQVDINIQGFPAQSYAGSDTVITTNNNDDCLSLWQVLIENGTSNAAIDNSAEFTVKYEGSNSCSYKLTEQPTLGFNYDSRSGNVTKL